MTAHHLFAVAKSLVCIRWLSKYITKGNKNKMLNIPYMLLVQGVVIGLVQSRKKCISFLKLTDCGINNCKFTARN